MSELIDNSAQRIEILKAIILDLHAGADPEPVKERLRALVGEVSGSEIAAMEQRLIAEGMAVEQVRGLCDIHHQVLRDLTPALDVAAAIPAGHPIDLMRRENALLGEAIAEVRAVQERVLAGDAPDLPRWRAALDRVLEVDKHYARKENLLFPKLEAQGITGPSQVMWAKDDEVRAFARALRGALAETDADAETWRLVVETIGVPLVDQADAMISREAKILLPMAHERLDEAAWAEIARETPRFGYCLVEPQPIWAPAQRLPVAGAALSSLPSATAAPAALPPGARVAMGVGALSLAEIRALFAVLPVDLTFVDADDRVAFFSEGDRVFARTPAVIGRKVQLCHPPKSVSTVERILADFKNGVQDVAEFWITMQGRFVHIRYFAVRDGDGRYLGTLEVTQDLARLRALEGERRLLAYESAGEARA